MNKLGSTLFDLGIQMKTGLSKLPFYMASIVLILTKVTRRREVVLIMMFAVAVLE
jgi:hypothetical protein